MSSNINYSIVSNDTGATVVRSTVKSFNLDHVTDKDVVSFYRNLSSYAMFDTGLMPLAGTGVLAIRSAGNHTQITFQHQAQLNHINWGATEGDANAKTYTVAQPYRIWIGDLIDGNMLGARMFYSPYPITSPDQPLYHLNLPNTNCKGYRGNGVGWQCLYHRDDWSNLPFNEKIVRFAERCSGVETYNDANMSETDGPRFYKDNDMPEYTWNPDVWQQKSLEEGIDWTLDPSNWIPILVKDQDHQDKHYPDGEPLTIQMAMLGDYQGYYTDNYRPKPINILSRSDLFMDQKTISNWIARVYNNSSTTDKSYNPMEASKEARLQFIDTILGGVDIDDEPEEPSHFIVCPISGEQCECNEDDVYADSEGNTYCEPCYSENVAYCENTDEYIQVDNPKVKWIDHESIHINKEAALIHACENCGTEHWTDKDSDVSSIKGLYTSSEDEQYCRVCLESFISSNFDDSKNAVTIGQNVYPVTNCYGCSSVLFKHDNWSHIFPTVKTITMEQNSEIDIDQPSPVLTEITFCQNCSSKYLLCPTGHYTLHWSSPMLSLQKDFNINILNPKNNEVIKTSLNGLCSTCINPDLTDIDKPENLIDITNPFSSNAFTYERYELSVLNNIAFGTSYCFNLDDPSLPF